MSTQPRIPSAIEGADPDFGSVTAHAGAVVARFFDLYAELWQNGLIEPDLRELTRLRNARITDCGY